ncbi:hypothetical protein SLEP1_g59598 [Rubroshorea leprosula]|uniref:Uncharacterized protein n=1 Tax=Rubroshorea leprosula TaxID=152421 RepID=A0AAV5MTY3_9ROSI|nr:hypothetical protein SLEP1_g59598 [Rubroshorea leprosula]
MANWNLILQSDSHSTTAVCCLLISFFGISFFFISHPSRPSLTRWLGASKVLDWSRQTLLHRDNSLQPDQQRRDQLTSPPTQSIGGNSILNFGVASSRKRKSNLGVRLEKGHRSRLSYVCCTSAGGPANVVF